MPALAVVALVLLYLGFPTADYYFDGLTFAMAVEGVAGGGDPAWLLHPHHLLYGPLAWVVCSAAWKAGVDLPARLLMAWLSTGLAVLALLAFDRLLDRMDFRGAVRSAAVLMLGASYAFWRFATQGETTMPLTAALMGLLLALAPRGTKPGPRPAALGAALGGAVLLHQAAVLFAPAVAVYLWRTSAVRTRAGRLLAFAAAGAAVSLGGYALACGWVLGGGPAKWLAWAAGYFGPDPRTGYAVSYGAWHPGAAGDSARAWVAAMFGGWPLSSAEEGGPWRVAAGAGAAAAGLLLVRLPFFPVRRRFVPGRGAKRWAPFLAALLLWLAAHALFFTWWKAGHVRFWLLSLPGWLILILAALRMWFPRRTAAAAWGLAVPFVVCALAGPAARETRPQANAFLPTARALAERTPPDAVVVISGVGPWTALKAYVPYVARRRMLILDWQFADRSVPPARALAALHARIRALAAERPVYLLSEALDPALDRHFESVHGVDAEARRRLFAACSPARAGVLADRLVLYRLSP